MKALKFLIAAATTADGRVMRLTPDAGWNSGAVYSSSAVQLGANATFSTTFQFRFTGNSQPADGMAFMLAASPNGLARAAASATRACRTPS